MRRPDRRTAHPAATLALPRGLPAVLPLVLPLVLAACAAPSVPPQAAVPPSAQVVAPPGPPGFSLAVRRGLPLTVGVYGVASDSGEEEFAQAAPDAGRGSLARMANGGSLPMLPEPPERLDDSISIGAGFFIGSDGSIATAAHVVAGARTIVVKTNDRRVFAAELVGADEESDIALIRIPVSMAVAPAMGRSAALRAGDWVVAIGDPYGLTRSVAAGIVGGGARHFVDDTDALFIQSDLALNPGNSGGPLLDASGNIVGMNLRMMVGPYGTAGVSLSMPIEMVMRLAQDLASGTPSTRPRLGAQFEDVSPPEALAAGRLLADGAVVTSVQPGGFADRIGLQADDIVVGFNGRPLGDSADLVRSLLEWESEEGTRITVYRAGDYLELTLPQGESPARGTRPR